MGETTKQREGGVEEEESRVWKYVYQSEGERGVWCVLFTKRSGVGGGLFERKWGVFFERRGGEILTGVGMIRERGYFWKHGEVDRNRWEEKEKKVS